jgi:hypothetical protein
MLPIVALSPISIKSGDILCHIQLLPISKFLPGKWDKFLNSEYIFVISNYVFRNSCTTQKNIFIFW